MDKFAAKIEDRTKIKIQKNQFYINDDIKAWLLLLPSLLCTYFIIIRPQVMGGYWSFFNMRGFTVVNFVGFNNYKHVLADTLFLKTFFNTCLYVIWSLVIGFVIPFVIAIIMNELTHFREATRVIVYMPSVIPAVAVSMIWYFVYYPDASGLLNMFLGKFGIRPYAWLQDSNYTILFIVVSMAWSGIGNTAIYYFAGLQGINRELYEAAVMDGAGFFRRIRMVTIPQMSGMLALFFVRQIIGVFNVMEQPLQMTDGGPNNASLSLGLLNYRYGFVQGKPQYSMALGVIMFITLSVFTYVYFKMNKHIEENQM